MGKVKKTKLSYTDGKEIKSKTLILPAMLDNLGLRKDGSVKLSFETRELTGDEINIILGYRNIEGWLQFDQNKEFVPAPETDAQLDGKSERERQEDLLYVLYKLKNITATFQTFRNAYLLKRNEELKKQIDELSKK